MNHLLALLFALSWVLFFLPSRISLIGTVHLPAIAITWAMFFILGRFYQNQFHRR